MGKFFSKKHLPDHHLLKVVQDIPWHVADLAYFENKENQSKEIISKQLIR